MWPRALPKVSITYPTLAVTSPLSISLANRPLWLTTAWSVRQHAPGCDGATDHNQPTPDEASHTGPAELRPLSMRLSTMRPSCANGCKVWARPSPASAGCAPHAPCWGDMLLGWARAAGPCESASSRMQAASAPTQPWRQAMRQLCRANQSTGCDRG